MNANGSAQTNLTSTPVADDFSPAWQVLPPPPIVFVHGFAGPRSPVAAISFIPTSLRLSSTRCASRLTARRTSSREAVTRSRARPRSSTRFRQPVYGPAVAFLDRIATNYVYVWDWRKSPHLALDELDAMVEFARCGGVLPAEAVVCPQPDVVFPKVVLMGHSMGGLVIRDYINDQSRADKVARALTVGTPYWGSPKAIFPLAAGLESPAAEALDNLIVDAEFQEWARTAQGLYYLYPTANFGDWLTVNDRQPQPLDRAGLLGYVFHLGGEPALLAHALDDHAQSLDGFKTNGVDYQAFVGSGVTTVESILFYRSGEKDYVELGYGTGDGTVPVRSGAQGPQDTTDPLGADIPIHYSCGVEHVPLPGDPSVTSRIEDFLVSGDPVLPGPTSASCNSDGFEIASSSSTSLARSRANAPEPMVEAAAAAPPMTLEEAELAGLIQLLDLGVQKVIVTDSRSPVELSYSADSFEVTATPLTNAELGTTSYYGPLSGAVTFSAGSTLAVTDASGPVTPRADGAPTLSIADGSVAEGSDASIAVTLSRAVAFPVVVDFKTEDGTATAAGDYSSREGTLVFDPGQLTSALSIPTNADGSVEQNETFRVVLSDPIHAATPDQEAVATILDSSGDTAPPDTIVDKGPKRKQGKPTVKFMFHATEDRANFECRLQGKRAKRRLRTFGPCSSPKQYKKLEPGRYTFSVRAADAARNIDPTPAKHKFEVTG